MADKRIEHDQIVAPEVFSPAIKSAEAMLLVIEKLDSGFKNVLTTSQSFLKQKTVLTTKGLEDTEKKLKDVDSATKGLSETNKAIIKVNEQLAKARTDEAVNLAKIKKEIQDVNFVAKQHAIIEREQAGSVNALRAQLALITNEWNKSTAAQREAVKAEGSLSQQKLNLTNQLKKLEGATGDTRRNVGNYTASIKEAFEGTGIFGESIGKLLNFFDKSKVALELFEKTLSLFTASNKAATAAVELNTVATEINTTTTKATIAATEAEIIAQNTNTAATEKNTIITEANILAEKETKIAREATIVATEAETLATGKLATAKKILNAITSPTGLIIAAVVALTKVTYDNITATDAQREEMDALKKAEEARLSVLTVLGINSIEYRNKIKAITLAEHELEDAMREKIILLEDLRRIAEEARTDAEAEEHTTLRKIELLDIFIEKNKEKARLEKELALDELAVTLGITTLDEAAREAAQKAVDDALENGGKLRVEAFQRGKDAKFLSDEEIQAATEKAVKVIAIETDLARENRRTLKRKTTIEEQDHKERISFLQTAQKEELEAIETFNKNKITQRKNERDKAIEIEKLNNKLDIENLIEAQRKLGDEQVDQREDFDREIEAKRNLSERKIQDITRKANEDILKINEEATKKAREEGEKARAELEKQIAEHNKKILDLATKQAITINQIEQEQIRGQVDLLQTRIDKEKAATKINIESINKIIDEQTELRKRALEDEASFKINMEKHTVEEIELINEKLKNDLQKLDSDALKTKQDFAKAEVETEKKKQQQIVDANFKTLSTINTAISDGLKERSDKAQKAIEKEQSLNEKAITRQEELAAKGLTNQLAFEEQKKAELAAKLEREKESQRQREEAAQLVGAYLEFLKERAKKDPNTAPFRALSDVLIAKAISKGIAGLYEGTESVGEEHAAGMLNRSKDNLLVPLHKGERVVGYEDSMKIKGLSNEELVRAGELYKSGLYIPELADVSRREQVDSAMAIILAKKIDMLNSTIKNKREYHVNWDEHGARVEEIVENGMKKVLKKVTTGQPRI